MVPSYRNLLGLLWLGIFVSLVGCKGGTVPPSPSPTPSPVAQSTAVPQSEPSPSETGVLALVESEEWILRQSPELRRLERAVLNLRLPDIQAAQLFQEQPKVADLSGESLEVDKIPHLGVSGARWETEKKPHKVSLSGLELWKPLFRKIAFFEWARFAIVSGQFNDPDRQTMETLVKFEGLARTESGGWLQIRAKQVLGWQEEADKSWRIASWKQKSLETATVDRPFFQDVVSRVLPRKLAVQVQDSPHERLLLRIKSQPHKYFSPHASDRHPSVSVVDIDGDGFDDLYLMARWGKNLLFRNLGDGTFEEIGAELGLDIKDHCSSAIFADFDNDGDPDLFLGRTLARSLYLRNENGRFVDRTASHVSTKLPYLTFSISAADYNGDGLMDVFFTTYAQEMQNDFEPDPKSQTWLAEFLTKEQAHYLYELREKHAIFERAGPPNVLLVNRGQGRFELAPENSQLEAWRQTTQGTWSDIDDDGDPDIYLSNDFSGNMLFRNDGPAGFVEITEQTGTADIGFGMGVSWGDFDLDGLQDLYVTNMFSKAGQRITAQLDLADPRVTQMSRGNSLLRNLNGRFDKVSGLDSKSLQVEKVGWSWGSQFIDVDNDGYLDIHAPSGFYTAPDDLALPLDL